MTTDTDKFRLTPTEGKSGAWADLKAGMYAAVLTDIVDAGISQKYPESGPQYELTFTLSGRLDENDEPITIKRWVTQKATIGKKTSILAEYATALGYPPVIGQPFIVSRLLGRPCQLFLNVKDTGNGPRPFIASLLPANGAQPAPAPTPAGASAVARPPLDERLAATPAAGGQQLDPCFICDGPGAAFDGKGRSVCETHKTMG